MDLVIRPHYCKGESWKQNVRDGSDEGEETCSSNGSQRARRSHGGYAASGGNAAIGDYEGHKANIESRRRGKEGNEGRGVSGTNKENEALEQIEGENCSERDGPGLEIPVSQDFEHQHEVMYHLKRRMNSTSCVCISSCGMSCFQPSYIYFKFLPQSLKHFYL